jgi:hypothetical protein
MKDDLFRGKLWSTDAKEKREPDRAPETPARRADDKVVPLPRPDDDRTYKAFDTRDRSSERLHIHCATECSRYPNYHHLLDIIFDHNFQEVFTLVYSFMVVEVTGQRLGEVVHAISYGNCECIREYHKKLYDPPAPNTTVIESVTILAAALPTAKAPAKAAQPTEG